VSATIVQNKDYKNKQKVKDNFISAIIGFFAFVWIFPILWTLWTSLSGFFQSFGHSGPHYAHITTLFPTVFFLGHAI